MGDEISGRRDLAGWVGYWFSASQVSTFDLCARKWAFQKIEGLRSPPGPSLALGLEMHGQLELWLREGRAINMTVPSGPIAMAGLHLLPMPKTPGLRIEQEFTIEIGGHKFRGYKDYEDFIPGWYPRVGDHKSTKDFRWAKTPDDLRTDPQGCLYAAETMWRTGTDACVLEWIYYRTTGAPKAEPVRVLVTRADVTPVLEQMVKSCDTMTALLDMAETKGLRALDIPPNASACDAFGGCEFQNLCNLSPAERMHSIMTQQLTSSDLLAKLDSMRNGQGINPPPNGQVALPMLPQQFAPPPHGPAPTPVNVNGRWVIPETVQTQPVLPPGPAPTPININGQWVIPPQDPPMQQIQMPPQTQMPLPLQTQPLPTPPQTPEVPLPPATTAPKPRRSKKQREADEAAAAAATTAAGQAQAPVVMNQAPVVVNPPNLAVDPAVPSSSTKLALGPEAGAALEQATQMLRAIANSAGVPDAKFIFSFSTDGSVKRSVSLTRGL